MLSPSIKYQGKVSKLLMLTHNRLQGTNILGLLSKEAHKKKKKINVTLFMDMIVPKGTTKKLTELLSLAWLQDIESIYKGAFVNTSNK